MPKVATQLTAGFPAHLVPFQNLALYVVASQVTISELPFIASQLPENKKAFFFEILPFLAVLGAFLVVHPLSVYHVALIVSMGHF